MCALGDEDDFFIAEGFDADPLIGDETELVTIPPVVKLDLFLHPMELHS